MLVFVLVYSALFHVFMAYEGRSYSWVAGLYWTLTVMSTLGLGDITFVSNVGQIFTMVVLLSGIGFFLVLLPLLFMEEQSAGRVPQTLPRDTSGHLILYHYDTVTNALINLVSQYRVPYVLIVPELEEALHLYDMGLNVMIGAIDHPDTLQRARVEHAVLVATTASDAVNTNIAFTVREMAPRVPIIATVNDAASIEILKMAGCSHVLDLGATLGHFLARRVLGGDAMTHIIGQFGQLLIAEAMVARTPLVGTTLAQSRIHESFGLNVVGVWDRGHFQTPRSDSVIGPHTVLVLAGAESQLRAYDVHFRGYKMTEDPVVILGGGRVGRATGHALEERGIDYRIIEYDPERIRNTEKYILGNAAEREVLEKAGIRRAPAVVLTTHNDDINIYLTIYCRRLRPDIQIISRATLDRNVATLHRAGADFVMSYASMGANTILNLLRRDSIVMVTEGLDIFKVPVPPKLVGKTLGETRIRPDTGCTVIAVDTDGTLAINPTSTWTLPAQAEMILIGTSEAEERFLQLYGKT
jgi:Trk K+ transport system NAD-binding subunit